LLRVKTRRGHDLTGRSFADSTAPSVAGATKSANDRVLVSDGSRRDPRAERRSRADVRHAVKRTVDLVGAVVGLVVLSPVFVGTMLLIALTDGRPVLFIQERAGLDGRAFRIYKFRTMQRDADAQRNDLRSQNEVVGGAAFKMTNDPRITSLGRLLRRTSIDELPQLLNVLRGEMSLVGPRPHPFDDVAGYEPWHLGRFAMKPGITGLWQVEARGDADFDRWVELDLRYIREWSPLLDLKILIRTVPAVLRGSGR
jgi:lipopolysaccharide/colanic/teichoic acid biosynthesis glycosyltransferase